MLTWRCHFSWSLLFLCALSLLAAAEPATKGGDKADALIAAYKGTTNVADKLKSLEAMKPLRSPALDKFLETEFSNLDGTREPGIRLTGRILELWSAHPTQDVLPYLIYEGLFHADAEVVRACATGIGRMSEPARALMSTGRAPRGNAVGEELAADLIQRLYERRELLHPLEKVLVLWSGKKREDYQAGVNLKSVPKEGVHAAAVAFWSKWYEERFRKPLKL